MQKISFDEKDLKDPEQRSKIVVSVVGDEESSLVTACLLADAGFKVFCLDSEHYITERLRRGTSFFAEPEFESLLERNMREGRLTTTTEFKESISNSHIIFLHAVPTVDQKKRPDYSNIKKLCRDIGLNLRHSVLVILEGDLAPGTTETLVKETLETASGQKCGDEIGLAYCSTRPSFHRRLQSKTNHPRVFGAIDKRSSELAKAFLSVIIEGEVTQVNNTKTAEAARLFENVYRDVNVALANDLACLCEKVGIDFMEVRSAVNSGSHHYLPVPKLVDKHVSDSSHLLIEEAENLKTKLRMAAFARKTNDAALNHIYYLVKDAIRSCDRTVGRSRVLVFGASCQPDVQELRGSFVKELVELLLGKGMFVKVYDPLFSRKELTEVGYTVERTLTEAVKGMDCLLFAVGHSKFKRLNIGRMRHLMKKPPAIVDISHIIDPYEAEKKGFVYRGLGRGVWAR